MGSQQEPVVVVAAEVEHPGRTGRWAGLDPPDPALRARQAGQTRPGRAGRRPRATRPGAPATSRAPRTRCSAGRARRSRAGRRRRRRAGIAGAADDDGVVVTTRHGHLRWAGRNRRPTPGRALGCDETTWLMSNTCSTPTTVTPGPDTASSPFSAPSTTRRSSRPARRGRRDRGILEGSVRDAARPGRCRFAAGHGRSGRGRTTVPSTVTPPDDNALDTDGIRGPR